MRWDVAHLFLLGLLLLGLTLKPGVETRCISGEMVEAVQVVFAIYDAHGLPEPVLTSVCEGDHIEGSLHSAGFAVDFRVRDVAKSKRPGLANAISEALGDRFDVVLEGNPSPHIHVEFDPD